MSTMTAAVLRTTADALDSQAQQGSKEREGLLISADTLRGVADAMDDKGATSPVVLEQEARRLDEREKRRRLIFAKCNQAAGEAGYGEDDMNFELPSV